MDVGFGSLLAREARHRVANDLAIAAGALRLALAGGAPTQPLAAAAERLEAAAEINSVLCREPVGAVVDLAADLGRLRRPLARLAAIAGWDLGMDVAPVRVLDDAASRVAMLVFELVSNSVRHAERTGGRLVVVRVRDVDGVTVLSVRDGGRATTWARQGGQGFRIVDALAASLGGTVHRGGATDGGCVEIFMPSLAGGAVDEASWASPRRASACAAAPVIGIFR